MFPLDQDYAKKRHLGIAPAAGMLPVVPLESMIGSPTYLQHPAWYAASQGSKVGFLLATGQGFVAFACPKRAQPTVATIPNSSILRGQWVGDLIDSLYLPQNAFGGDSYSPHCKIAQADANPV